MRREIVVVPNRPLWQWKRERPAQALAHLCKGTGSIDRKDMVTEGRMGARQGMAQNGKAAMPGMLCHPGSQGLVGEPVPHICAIKGYQPISHRLFRARTYRQIQQRGSRGGKVGRDSGSASWLEIRGSGQVEPIKSGERVNHFVIVGDLRVERFGVLFLELFVEPFDPGGNV